MVCKEELCTWFKDLSPHKRIDFMCGMLNMCLPMELRFMGSYVEDLAKKDFHQLRESESKANSRQELSNFNEKDGKAFRTKMAIYLALLHSSNRTCSNIIFELLENNIKEAFTINENMNEMTIHNILLVLSMAMNHPAFSYHQKSRMYEYYKCATNATRRMLKPDQELFPPQLLSCETRLFEQTVSPAYSPQPPVHFNTVYSPVVTDKVHVCNIEVKGCRVQETEKRTVEYRMQVTWSNGEETEVFKTYQELEDFHNQLIQKFPEEARYFTQTLDLPVIQGSVNHKVENTDQLNEYTRNLSQLPTHLLQCGLFLNFFVGGQKVVTATTAGCAPSSSPAVVQMMDASTSPRPQSVPDLPPPPPPVVNHITNSGEAEAVILPYLNKPQPVVYNTYLPQSPATDVVNLSPSEPDQPGLNVSTALVHSPSCSTKTTSPLISSPCHSSASSMESPPPSQPTSPRQQASPAHPVSPAHTVLPAHPMSPGNPISPNLPMSPDNPASPGNPMSPTQQMSPALQMSPSHQMSPLQPVLPVPQMSPGHQMSPSHQMSAGHQTSPGHQMSPGNQMSPQHQMSPGHSASPAQPGSPSLQERGKRGDTGRAVTGVPPYNNEMLSQYTTDQLNSMRLEEPEDQNSKEAAANMKNVIEPKAREKPVLGHLPNGLTDHHHPLLWHHPGIQGPPHAHHPATHHPFLPPGHHPGAGIPAAVTQYPMPPPQMYSYHQVFQAGGVGPGGGGPGLGAAVAAARAFSPSHSLNSSPSPSPSSSDDSDKDKLSSQRTINGKGKGHGVSGLARSARQMKTADDANFSAGNENGNSLKGHNGYNSDPTYNATRPHAMRPPAQPAHTNVTIGGKYVISMPESGFKPVPFAIPQHVSMTSSTGNHGYSTGMSDSGQRHLVYVQGPQTLFNRTYPLNQMNHARPIYGNGVLQSSPSLNHGLNSSLQQGNPNPNTNGSTTGKVFQGSNIHHPTPTSSADTQNPAGTLAGIWTSAGEDRVLVNGNDNNASSQPSGVELCGHRAVSSSGVPSTTTVTYTSACQSGSVGNHTTCTHCGCAGASTHTSPSPSTPTSTSTQQQQQQQQPGSFPYPGSLPQAPHAMLASPYSNGLLPMQGMHHPIFVHPNHYPNGLNQEFVYNAQLHGLMNAGNQSVGFPGMYGYSIYNAQGHGGATGGGYPKKPKKPNCHNCGSSKHMAGECNEVSMEAMSSQTMYSYKPKSDSD